MSIPFSRQQSTPNLSVTSKQSSAHVSAQEVYDQLYGSGRARGTVEAVLQQIYEPNASIYENPLLTATSRALITDIYHAAQQWSEVDMPKPLTVFTSLFRKADGPREPWFRVLRVWSEVGDICEAESFDGHRKSMVEHTLHFLLLPGIHSGRSGRHAASESSLDIVSPLYSIPHFQRSSQPSLAVPGTRLSWPSPLHLKLRVISRLEFNGERVTHHRDFWDVKDLVGLVPGAKLAQYVGTRLAGRALATIGNLGAWYWGKKGLDVEPDDIHWPNTGDNSLGLVGIDVESARLVGCGERG